jgi:hypothetical protein
VCKCTVVSHVSSCIAQTTLSSWTKSGSMSPLTTKVALDSKTRRGRMTGSEDMAVGADVVGTVLSIMTSMMAPKTLGKSRGGESSNGNINNTGGGREDRTIISDLYHERLI